MSRLNQVVLIGSTCLASWLGMQAVHELGHVLGARLSGGQVTRVVLHPLTISRTDLGANPHPLLTVWAGPVVGAVLPIVLWLAAAQSKLPGAFVLRFFAGFCLVANGLYIGGGSFHRVGDCGEMLQHGSQRWHLWLFGAVTVPIGMLFWHGQGRYFGLGPAAERIRTRMAFGSLLICIALLTLGLMIDGT